MAGKAKKSTKKTLKSTKPKATQTKTMAKKK